MDTRSELTGVDLMSSLRGWGPTGDGRLVRNYAWAMAMGLGSTRLARVARSSGVDLGKSIRYAGRHSRHC